MNDFDVVNKKLDRSNNFIHDSNFMNALLKYYGIEIVKKLSMPKVFIGGVGGLGSNCAVNLIRNGVLNLRIADFDTVDWSNLNRQYYFANQVGMVKVEALKANLLAINNNANIEIHNVKIEESNVKSLVKDCDIIVEAFDNPISKSLIVTECLKQEKYIVSASGLAGYGRSERIKTRKIGEKLYVIGDLESEVSENLPPYPAIVSIAAAKEADVVISLIINELNLN